MRNYNKIYRLTNYSVSIHHRKVGILKFDNNHIIRVCQVCNGKICFVDVYCGIYNLSYIGSGDLLNFINVI